MFFVLSKALAWALEPATWFLILQAVALALLLRRYYRTCVAVLAVSTLGFFLMTQMPIAGMLIRPLEQAVKAPRELPPTVDGIVVLGGAFDMPLTDAYGKPQLNAEAERITEFVALARRHPEAQLVFTGGEGVLQLTRMTEADAMRQFLARHGIDPARAVYEEKSRNTYESVIYTKRLVNPQLGQTWVLITSANHMPRAIGIFRKAQWNAIPFPVSYHALPAVAFGRSERRYETLNSAIHEWAGILAYRLAGMM